MHSPQMILPQQKTLRRTGAFSEGGELSRGSSRVAQVEHESMAMLRG